jgi:2-dehydro-3-deoxyglucarate aldolase
MNINVKAKLKRRVVTIGSWVTFGHTAVGEIMAKAGFDWLAVDMEHSAITLSETQQLIQVIELSGATPLVRIGENSPYLIKRVMDTGAHGVIVPMVNTKEDAMRAVKAVKYPPMGTRGVGLARAQGYGMDFDRYRAWINPNSIIIAQIEHIQAIENLEEILSVPGIDGSIIGPYDLSASLGIPGEFEDIRVEKAIDRYERISKKLGKVMGSHVVQPDVGKTNSLIKKGYTFLAVGLDSLYLGIGCQGVLRGIKNGTEKKL